MAFFKFRKSGDEPSAMPVQPESVEVMRRRAKHRLIGAAVLVLVGVIGFPLVFDKQPRPILVDMPIEIPDRNKVKAPNIPAPSVKGVVGSELVAPAPPTVPVMETAAKPMIEEKATVPPVAVASESSKLIAKAEPQPAEKPADKPAQTVQPAVKADEATKVQALLDGKDPDKKADASEGRYVVQVGAFADAARAREVRLKVEHAGLKTYTQVAGTKDAPRIRVRVGPFATKAEADKAAEKIKKLDLPAALLTL
nr:SPOR domain-containing protein [Rhodoferax sp.]